MKVKISRKRKGNILISCIICIVVIGIIFSGIYASNSNLIKLSSKQKDYLYLENTLLSEINYYSSLQVDNIVDKNYKITEGNYEIDVTTTIIEENKNYIELKIEVSNEGITKSKTVNLTK